jgi:hypothetical protein
MTTRKKKRTHNSFELAEMEVLFASSFSLIRKLSGYEPPPHFQSYNITKKHITKK